AEGAHADAAPLPPGVPVGPAALGRAGRDAPGWPGYPAAEGSELHRRHLIVGPASVDGAPGERSRGALSPGSRINGNSHEHAPLAAGVAERPGAATPPGDEGRRMGPDQGEPRHPGMGEIRRAVR